MFLFSLLVIKDIKFKQFETDSNQKFEENWNVFLANMKSKGEMFDSFFFFFLVYCHLKTFYFSLQNLQKSMNSLIWMFQNF